MVIKFRDEEMIKILSSLIEEKLEEGAALGELIDVTDLKEVGKTTALINFANRYGYAIIVPTAECKHRYKSKGFNDAYLINEVMGHEDKLFVIEEGVLYEDVKRLKDSKLMVTGLFTWRQCI